MKLLSSLHNPKHSKYVWYYSAVLVVIFTTGIMVNFGILHLSHIEKTMLYFEGFSSLFMLGRNEKVGNAFLAHLSKLHIVKGWYALK